MLHIQLAPSWFLITTSSFNRLIWKRFVFYLNEGEYADEPWCYQHPQGIGLLAARGTLFPIKLEDERARLSQSGYFNDQEVFRQVDRRETDRVQPQDIINFLGVHRIAANERECQFLIWTAGSTEAYLTYAQ